MNVRVVVISIIGYIGLIFSAGLFWHRPFARMYPKIGRFWCHLSGWLVFGQKLGFHRFMLLGRR